MRILLSGQPGVGKTSLVQWLAGRVERPAGFYTAECREAGTRGRTGKDSAEKTCRDNQK